MRRIFIFSLMSVFALASFFDVGFAFETNAKIIPAGKVNVYQEGKLIAVFTREAPLPTGVVLSCEGRCGVKMSNISVVAEDESLFSIDHQGNTLVVNLRQGTIYFGVSIIPDTLVFVTPRGAVSANQVIFKASGELKMVEGYLKVDVETCEIGVIEGGALSLLTKNEAKILEPGSRLILSMADIGENNPKVASGEESDYDKGGWFLTDGNIASFGIGSAITGGIIGSFASDLADDHDHDASPSTP